MLCGGLTLRTPISSSLSSLSWGCGLLRPEGVGVALVSVASVSIAIIAGLDSDAPFMWPSNRLLAEEGKVFCFF